jgi:mitogen-activated protein kinase kinase kinase
MTPSHAIAPSLDDLRRKLVRFMLPEEGHSCTINAEDCTGGIEVLEKVLKKFNKLGSRSDSSDIMDLVEIEDGGLSVDGWGVYIDWGQGDGQGLYNVSNFCGVPTQIIVILQVNL